ncbi:Response regulator receiver protein [Flavobacterium anhuiense]|uniref:Response regulator receiver protein n=1 Tax=Flavobacterium anhuiense TaxID=459526 RepID=A0A444W1B5_9FLAO|nr:helix-turn-helix domain-containing protein [Flavobacterium anhuiense]RYJ39667.1 Response regulator receiver protein [Flavobacterium anhuiense]
MFVGNYFYFMKYSKFIKVLFFTLTPIFFLAQNKNEDLTKLSYDALHDLYFANSENQKRQFEIVKTYLNKANIENIDIRKAKAYYHFAILYYKKDSDKAIKYLDSVIKYSQNTKDHFFPAVAYCEKADLLKRKYKFKEAMLNYNLAEKIAIKNNIDYYYIVREYIAITKSEDLGDYNEALDIFKECYGYYKHKDTRSPKYAGEYQSIIFGLADCYKSLKNIDSTTYYNNLGYQESKATNNEEYKYLFVLNEGANQALKKNYKIALDSIEIALPKMIFYNNTGNVLAAYYYRGKIYEGLGKKTLAAQNFIKVDSINNKTGVYSGEFIDGYSFLISYYKKLGNKENQLKYIITYMSIDSTLQKNYRALNKIVNKEYDMPHLISEKEELIDSLHNKQTKFYWGLWIFFLIIILSSGFGLYQYELKKRYRLRFEKIVSNTIELQESKIKNSHIEKLSANSKNDDNIGITEEVVNQILEKLTHFENEKKYLETNITIQILSNSFETNSKYISKIVNTYKGKTFIQYINDLRIEYAISELKQNSKIRKYTIHALALEFGFNNAESFSSAFYKKTGIKPSYFIKELDMQSEK